MGEARVEVLAAVPALLLIDDDEATSWTPDTPDGNCQPGVRVGTINILVGGVTAPTQCSVLSRASTKPIGWSSVPGPFGDGQWLRFGGVGYCDANQIISLHRTAYHFSMKDAARFAFRWRRTKYIL